MSDIAITKQEFAAWQENKVTQAVIDLVKSHQDQVTEYLVGGNTVNEPYSTALMVGRHQGIGYLFDLEWIGSEVVSDD